MGARENKVERYLHEQIENIGGTTRKWVSPGVVGVPDRIVIIKGDVFFVEVKTDTGRISVAQEREIERLRSYGALVHVVQGHDGVDQLMKTIRGLYA